MASDERLEEIRLALTQFNPLDDDLWTTAGLPKLTAFDGLLEPRPSRAEIEQAIPNFTRDKAAEKADAALDALFSGDDEESTPSAGGDDPVPDAPAPRPASPTRKEVDILDRPLSEIYADETLLRTYIKRLTAEERAKRTIVAEAEAVLTKINYALQQASRVKDKYDEAAKRKLSPSLQQKQHVAKQFKRRYEAAVRRKEVVRDLPKGVVEEIVRDTRAPIDKKFASRRRASERGT